MERGPPASAILMLYRRSAVEIDTKLTFRYTIVFQTKPAAAEPMITGTMGQ
jgi:hypothetical protein